MYVVVRTNDVGTCTVVGSRMYQGLYAACRVLDDVHHRYEHLEASGICALDRVSDSVLCVRWEDGREYQYSVHGLMPAVDAPTLAGLLD